MGEPLRFIKGDVVMIKSNSLFEKGKNNDNADLMVLLQTFNNHTCNVEGGGEVFIHKDSHLKLGLPNPETRSGSSGIGNTTETGSSLPSNPTDPIGTESTDPSIAGPQTDLDDHQVATRPSG